MAHRTIKHSKTLILFTGFLILSALFLGSCYYDNEEDLYPNIPPCDTANVKYSETVAPVMANHCNGCHGGSFPAAGIRTDTYEGLSVVAANGRLWGSINHQQGFSFMPKDAPKLSACDLAKIRMWLDEGYPDN